MTTSDLNLTPAQAARRLGISSKALRLYEARGLLVPLRNRAGWRFYGKAHMERAAEIAALRALGLSLAQIGQVLGGATGALASALSTHLASIEARMQGLAAQAERVRSLRSRLEHGERPDGGALTGLLGPRVPAIRLTLPWPWDGETFELPVLPPITFLTGPLGSGKTRLAMALAAVPGGVFLGLERVGSPPPADPALQARIDTALAWLAEDGATVSADLMALLRGLLAGDANLVVVDLVEQGLDETTQSALVAWLRRRGPDAVPVVLMTRSTAILDLGAVRPEEVILYCPPNHAPPRSVLPFAGAAGHAEVAACLATPAVRRRTQGMMAAMPQPASVKMPG
jgi:Predicted transcriptional regulators